MDRKYFEFMRKLEELSELSASPINAGNIILKIFYLVSMFNSTSHFHEPTFINFMGLSLFRDIMQHFVGVIARSMDSLSRMTRCYFVPPSAVGSIEVALNLLVIREANLFVESEILMNHAISSLEASRSLRTANGRIEILIIRAVGRDCGLGIIQESLFPEQEYLFQPIYEMVVERLPFTELTWSQDFDSNFLSKISSMTTYNEVRDKSGTEECQQCDRRLPGLDEHGGNEVGIVNNCCHLFCGDCVKTSFQDPIYAYCPAERCKDMLQYWINPQTYTRAIRFLSERQ